ncbi:hypothetical protein AMTR_s00019p00020740 [Amborella trichopoda]|uniref:Uncharacterized protein n=1 Tax=Amborella trichopoda TaxID=13333 RepID=W1PH59_AMBTC|nr:hypothetical protein AMTR_s00019p00020740 [Amborella trichopoda]
MEKRLCNVCNIYFKNFLDRPRPVSGRPGQSQPTYINMELEQDPACNPTSWSGPLIALTFTTLIVSTAHASNFTSHLSKLQIYPFVLLPVNFFNYLPFPQFLFQNLSPLSYQPSKQYASALSHLS